MSGHSKWANIKRQKAVVDSKKGVVYAKMSREIIVAAKLGGGDPAGNFRLRTAIDRAKAEGVPNDNIHRAIEKGSGGGNADSFEELVYEGYGPGGVALLVKCTTDNRNRTAGDVRLFFSKYGGNLGESGCVNWMFKEQGEVYIKKAAKFDEEALLETALEAGAEDLDVSDGDEARAHAVERIADHLADTRAGRAERFGRKDDVDAFFLERAAHRGKRNLDKLDRARIAAEPVDVTACFDLLEIFQSVDGD